MASLIVKHRKNIIIIINSFLLSLLFFLAPGPAHSQQEVILDCKGTDFWFTFLPNYHNSTSSSDSLYIFLAAEEATKGSISYKDIAGGSHMEYFDITDPDDIYTFKVKANDYELKGYNQSSILVADGQNGKIAPQHFHIESEKEITVYGHSEATMSSESFLALPTDVLSTYYIVMSYESHYPANDEDTPTPSQFAVIATEDDTQITIKPAAHTRRYGRNEINQTLDKGESFLIQADVDYQQDDDLTGSEIISNKPVAVLGGHQRAGIPVITSYRQSRDMLIDQLPPVRTWGKSAYIIPFKMVYGANQKASDRYRVLAAYDNTIVSINGQVHTTLNKGEFFEENISGPAVISANKQILVAEFKKTSKGEYSGDMSTIQSDPLMMLIPPKEQFIDEYKVINIQTFKRNIVWGYWEPQYDNHYISVVMPMSEFGSLKLDETTIYPQPTAIPGTDYGYYIIEVTSGEHNVKADVDFGIMVYGYGSYNSYGYIGGMRFETLYSVPPLWTHKAPCYEMNITAIDTSADIVSYRSASFSKANNLIPTINWPGQYRDTIQIKAELIDPHQDGSATILLTDSLYITYDREIEVAGFTVQHSQFDPEPLEEYDTIIKTAGDYCLEVELENYGKFKQTITDIGLQHYEDYYLQEQLPIDIMPGETKKINLCIKNDSIPDVIDTLFIDNGCSQRQILALLLQFRADREHPKVTAVPDSCNTLITVIATDSLATDWGLSSYNFTVLENCTIEQIQSDIDKYEIRINITDPLQDTRYSLSVSDKFGHITLLSDEIPGATLGFPEFDSQTEPDKTMHIASTADFACDSLLLHNYGNFEIVLHDPIMLHNLVFSVPQAQFPLVLPPDSSEYLKYCMGSTKYSDEILRDTILFRVNCVDFQYSLQGTIDPIGGQGNSHCDSPVGLTQHSYGPGLSLTSIYPNPFKGSATVEFYIPEKQLVKLNVYSLYGEQQMNLLHSQVEKGLHLATINTDDLAPGMYVCRLETAGKIVESIFIVY